MKTVIPRSALRLILSLPFSTNTLWLVTRLLPLVACLLFFSSVSHASMTHPACTTHTTLPINVYRFSADLDGVDGLDLYVADRTGESTVITACDDSSLGPWDMHDTNKPLNTVVVVDVEGDGTDELIVGGSTGSSPLSGAVARLNGTQLELGETISVRPANDFLAGETFRCLDTNDDGKRNIVNYAYRKNVDGSEVRWNGSDDTEGVFKLPSQATDDWIFRSGQCGDRIVINLEFRINGYPQSVALDAVKSHLAQDRPVQFGINNNLLFQKFPEKLTDADDWAIPLEHYAGYEGPFSILNLLEKAQKLTIGPHNHCVGAPLDPPKFVENDLIQISAQPSQTNSCLQWFSVDFWMRKNFTIVAIIVNIWEP